MDEGVLRGWPCMVGSPSLQGIVSGTIVIWNYLEHAVVGGMQDNLLCTELASSRGDNHTAENYGQTPWYSWVFCFLIASGAMWLISWHDQSQSPGPSAWNSQASHSKCTQMSTHSHPILVDIVDEAVTFHIHEWCTIESKETSNSHFNSGWLGDNARLVESLHKVAGLIV